MRHHAIFEGETSEKFLWLIETLARIDHARPISIALIRKIEEEEEEEKERIISNWDPREK